MDGPSLLPEDTKRKRKGGKRSEYEHGAAKSVQRHAEGLYADIRGYSQSGDSLRAEEKDRIEIDQAEGGIRC